MTPFTIVAIVAAYNEADIIGQVIGHLIRQRLSVYFLDDGSTDGTVAAVEPFVGKGVIAVEKRADAAGEAGFDWVRILRRKEALAAELAADWFIHHDADEFRESPWDHLDLHDAIRTVDHLGYNAIDFKLLNFPPTDDGFQPGDDVGRFSAYQPGAPWDKMQIKCWKKTRQPIDLVSSGGHEACFSNRRVCPIQFVLRHYPIRSQAHGERKVFGERVGRFSAGERDRGWHVQYEAFEAGHNFLRHPASLFPYEPEAIRAELTVKPRDTVIEERDADLQRLSSSLSDALLQLASARELGGSLTRQVAHGEKQLASARELVESLTRQVANDEKQLASERQGAEQRDRLAKHEIESLRSEIQTAVEGASSLSRELRSVYASKSWRLTQPLRTTYGLFARTSPDSTGANREMPRAGAKVNWGDLGTSPISNVWGLDRGLPIDRHYIEGFLNEHRGDIRGDVLEVKDSHYSNSIGGSAVTTVEVIDIDASNARATLVADLARADTLPADRFDCFVLTQTLHIIYDVRAALGNAARMLKPGGVLLCTLPAVSRVNDEDGGLASGDYWRFTAAAVGRLFADFFNPEDVSVDTYGNVRVCTAFLYGLAAQDLEPADLGYNDPWFPLIHCVRAVKRVS